MTLSPNQEEHLTLLKEERARKARELSELPGTIASLDETIAQMEAIDRGYGP